MRSTHLKGRIRRGPPPNPWKPWRTTHPKWRRQGAGIEGEEVVWEARYAMRNFLGRLAFRALLTVAWLVFAVYALGYRAGERPGMAGRGGRGHCRPALARADLSDDPGLLWALLPSDDAPPLRLHGPDAIGAGT